MDPTKCRIQYSQSRVIWFRYKTIHFKKNWKLYLTYNRFLKYGFRGGAIAPFPPEIRLWIDNDCTRKRWKQNLMWRHEIVYSRKVICWNNTVYTLHLWKRYRRWFRLRYTYTNCFGNIKVFHETYAYLWQRLLVQQWKNCCFINRKKKRLSSIHGLLYYNIIIIIY
jgi:hypothetical protein